MTQTYIRVGTRASPLARIQAQFVADQLGIESEIIPISTRGDRYVDRPLGDMGGKGLFIKELEEALLDDTIDLAVHSMKDMTTQLQEPFAIGCILQRADARDAFISLKASSIQNLPQAAHVGTASLRRQAYVQLIRPDLRISLLRGNVGSRLEKLRAGQYDATFLAMAGLQRLGLNESFIYPLPILELIPAPAQGAIGVECLSKRHDILKLLSNLHHAETALCIAAERAFLRQLDGSCRTAIGCHVTQEDNRLKLYGCIYKNQKYVVELMRVADDVIEAEVLGVEAANNILQQWGM